MLKQFFKCDPRLHEETKNKSISGASWSNGYGICFIIHGAKGYKLVKREKKEKKELFYHNLNNRPLLGFLDGRSNRNNLSCLTGSSIDTNFENVFFFVFFLIFSQSSLLRLKNLTLVYFKFQMVYKKGRRGLMVMASAS